MPMYVHGCDCGHQQEDFLSVNAPAPEHCGKPMKKLPQVAGSAFVTRKGNLYNLSMPGKQWVGGGRPKPKVIGRGHGLGGRRPNPTMKKVLEKGIPVQGKVLRTAKEK